MSTGTGTVRIYNEAGDVVVELVQVVEAERVDEKVPAELAAFVAMLRRSGAGEGLDEQTLVKREAHYRGTLTAHDVDRYPGADGERFRLVDDTGPTTIVLTGVRPRALETKMADVRALLGMVAGRPLPGAGGRVTLAHLDVRWDRLCSLAVWQAEQTPVRLDQ